MQCTSFSLESLWLSDFIVDWKEPDIGLPSCLLGNSKSKTVLRCLTYKQILFNLFGPVNGKLEVFSSLPTFCSVGGYQMDLSLSCWHLVAHSASNLLVCQLPSSIHCDSLL